MTYDKLKHNQHVREDKSTELKSIVNKLGQTEDFDIFYRPMFPFPRELAHVQLCTIACALTGHINFTSEQVQKKLHNLPEIWNYTARRLQFLGIFWPLSDN